MQANLPGKRLAEYTTYGHIGAHKLLLELSLASIIPEIRYNHTHSPVPAFCSPMSKFAVGADYANENWMAGPARGRAVECDWAGALLAREHLKQ